jgi:exopolysaccharide/PEP-CTERM locus tyrosine autokinase
VKLIEKALGRVKRDEHEVTPLGQYKDGGWPNDTAEVRPTEAAAHGISSGHTSGGEPCAPRSGGRLVAVDRDRLREEGFLAPEKYQRQMADEYRRIKRPLIVNAFGTGESQVERGNLILVSSAVTGEGKTHTCLNLALSMAAERDRTVLLVDGDVPKPHISRLFGVADQPGLLDFLGDHPPHLENLLIRTDIPRLSVLPAGKWTDHAPELLGSSRMAELCRELSGRYPDRIILFDSPPLLAATEALAIAAHVGQVVLVIAENITACGDVRAALGLLDGQKPINAILNKSRRATLGGYYYGGYGYGTHADASQQAPEAGRS